MLLYGIADLAFVGGSLVERGGHNPLEAAAHAIPVLMGPHTFNFKDICALAGAGKRADYRYRCHYACKRGFLFTHRRRLP